MEASYYGGNIHQISDLVMALLKVALARTGEPLRLMLSG
jgi:hypothetical protein